jgi:hypothetical protein
MPLDPPSEADDSLQRTGTSYPDDWIYPDDWFVPAPPAAPATAQPASGSQPNLAAPGISGQPVARPDPLAAYWSLIPASRAGAMAWHPPIFLSPNPSSPENIPPSTWVTPPPSFPISFGQFPSTTPAPPDLPLVDTSRGLLGGIAKMLAASAPPTVPGFDASRSLLGAVARLPAARAPLGMPPIDTERDLSASMPETDYPAGEDGTPTFNANGILSPGLGAPSPAATAAPSFAEAGSSPGGSAFVGSNSNPFLRLLNALNPISSANAAEDEGGGLPPALAEAVLHGLLGAAAAKQQAEQQQILNDALDARRELFEVAQGRASSRALGVALEASGVPRPKGYAAHHIAAGADEHGELAREVLKKFNIGINDVTNGVFLPANRATQVIAGETIHSTLHTKGYYDAVNAALAKAATRQQAINILQDIRMALQSGDYP